MNKEQIDILNKKLNLNEILNEDEKDNFINAINKYFSTNRVTFEYFIKRLDRFIILYTYILHFTIKDVIKAIISSPTVIHEDTEDLFLKYLILAKMDNLDNMSGRDDVFINHPKDLRIGINNLYGRLMFLLSDNGITRNDNITRKKLLTITNDNWETTYKITKEQLINKYPLSKENIEEIKNWEENKNLLNTGGLKRG